MVRKIKLGAAILVPMILLAGCSKEEKVQAVVAPKLVKTIVVAQDLAAGSRIFPGRIDAVQKAQVSFRVAGKLKQIHVKEGNSVEQGALLAELDPTDFQIRVNERKANFQRAEADYLRGKELIKDNYISKAQFDKMEADYLSSKAAKEQAEQELNYTRLTAPFAGIIGKRYVENFEEVQAKQEIFNLSDVTQVDISIDVPEQVMRIAKQVASDIRVVALLDGIEGKEFPLILKEAATTADPQTKTFEVTFTMPQPEGINLLPGMSATVRVDMHMNSKQVASRFLLPGSAVKGAADMSPTVMVVDSKTNQLQARAVKVGHLRGDQIEILDGVVPGERIVVAGVAFLRDGDKVTLMADVEQASPATAP